jgi:hypothetical protein
MFLLRRCILAKALRILVFLKQGGGGVSFQRGIFLEGANRRPQGAFQSVIFRCQQCLDGICMPDPTFELRQSALFIRLE